MIPNHRGSAIRYGKDMPFAPPLNHEILQRPVQQDMPQVWAFKRLLLSVWPVMSMIMANAAADPLLS